MSLSSISFVFGALPIFILIYYISKPQFRIYELLLFSIWFYCVNEINLVGVGYAIGIIAINYLLSVLINHFRGKPVISRICFIAVIVLDAGALFYYKWYGFSLDVIYNITGIYFSRHSIIGVVGISFFTFSLISYVSDVYHKKCSVPKNPVNIYIYILMFPKILMGPIVRYSDISHEIEHSSISAKDIGIGAKRFMIGFCKKTIIADNLAMLVNEINGSFNLFDTTVTALWIGAIGYSLQLFFDFSGYSDMAIGLAQMFGFHFQENFNYPYMCKSFNDFWKRWHISLSRWFRDYIYIPLGGSKCSAMEHIFHLFIVWLLTGMWHGTGYTFITWGLVYFVFLVIEKYLVKPDYLNGIPKAIWRIITLLIVNFNWVLFSHDSITEGLKYCSGMVGLSGHLQLINTNDIRYFREYGIYLAFAVLFSMPIVPWLKKKLLSKPQTKTIATIIISIMYLIAFLWGVSFVLLGFHNPFIYQQF